MRCRLLKVFAVGCWLLSGAVVSTTAFAAPKSIKVGETEYVSVNALAADFGMLREWTSPGKALRLTSRAMRIDLQVDSRDCTINGTRAFLGDGAVFQNKALYVSRIDRERLLVPLIAPARAGDPPSKPRVIVIDAGHGGRDTGTRNKRYSYDEKVFALDVAKRLERLLTEQGYSVFQTRKDDSFIPLEKRPEVAELRKADLFISVHFNAISNPEVTGIETFILTPRFQRSTGSDAPEDNAQPGNRWDVWNALLGFKIHSTLISEIKGSDRGLKRARFAVLRSLQQCPGVLIEGGYLSNDAEARRIADPAWRERLAQSIVRGVNAYRDAIPAPQKKRK